MVLVLPAVLCLATGYLIVALASPVLCRHFADWLLRLSLSVGFGVGGFSLVCFLSRVCGFDHLFLADLVVLAMLTVAWLCLRRRIAAADVQKTPDRDKLSPPWFHRVITASFVTVLLAALYATIRRAIAHPHGDGWDAFAIWNLHARFLFRGGSHWRDGFSALLPWSHPDYPPLLPAGIAHFWTYLGHENQLVPAALGVVFAFSTVALLISALLSLRGSTAAMLGGLTLLSTPFFVEQSAAQYADVPLSFYFLAAIALLAIYDWSSAEARNLGWLVLAGLAAGFAACTKNEGVLFALSIIFARLLAVLRRDRGWRSLLVLAISLAPALLLMIWFKHSIAPPSELFADQSALHKLAIPARYWITLKWYGKDFLRFGEWAYIPGTLLLAGLHFAAGTIAKREQKPEGGFLILALLLTLAGYFVIYLITPYDLYWHLRFSLNRLFLQLWPSAIFLFFLADPIHVTNAESVC